MADQITTTAPVAIEQPQEPTAVVPEVEALGDGGKAALAAERKARRDADAQLKALQSKLAEFEDRDKSELEKLQTRLAAAEKSATEATLKALRADVAQAKGVPAGLLSGSTEDELNAAADALLAFRGKPASAPPAAGTQGNTGTPIGAGTVSEQLHQQIDAATKAGRHAEAISLKRQLSALNNKTN